MRTIFNAYLCSITLKQYIMKTKTFYVVQYNDCYGNGDNKRLEVIVESHDDFKEWLKQRNEEREEFGECEESEEEFNLISLNLFK